MKTLELNQMENVQGGMSCGAAVACLVGAWTGLFLSAASGVGILAGAVAVGGVIGASAGCEEACG